MLTININGIDAIDRVEIAKYYKSSLATAARRIEASGIQPVACLHRLFYPVVEVLDYFDSLPPVMPAGQHLRPKTATTATK
jgi:hypothetical protein